MSWTFHGSVEALVKKVHLDPGPRQLSTVQGKYFKGINDGLDMKDKSRKQIMRHEHNTKNLSQQGNATVHDVQPNLS